MNILVIDGYNVIARGLAANPKRDMADDDARRGYREELVGFRKDCVRAGGGLKSGSISTVRWSALLPNCRTVL